MMKTTRFLSLAALALVGAMMTGCSSDDNIIDEQQPKGNVVTLTTTVNFDDATTRALDIDYAGKTLAKTFAEGDKIAVVYQNASGTTVKAVTEALTTDDLANGGKSATFTVTLTDPKQNGSVKYIYPAAMAGTADVDFTKLGTQDGTLATIASSLDLATYEGTLTDDATLPASPSLENGLAIVAYTLKDADGTNDITSTITGMTVSDGTNTYTVNRTAAEGPIYVAIQPTASADIEYTATDGTTNYTKSVTAKKYDAGQFYQLGLKMEKKTPDMTATPLTLLVTTGGNLVFYDENNAINNLKYTVNSGAAQSASVGGTISGLNVGDVVTFYCNGTQSSMGSDELFDEGSTTIKAQVYGNPMSLLDGTNFATMAAVGAKAFYSLFYMDAFLSNHPTNDLVLPATTLASECYQIMFRYCTGLTRTPKLPATTLTSKCYQGMFADCKGLTDAYVAAPYTTSNNEMYGMFNDITANQTTLHTTADAKDAWDDCDDFSFKAVVADYDSDATTGGESADGISAASAYGTVGTYTDANGVKREGIVVTLSGKKYAIATANETSNATWTVDGVAYYNFADAKNQFANNTDSYSAANVWRLPTKAELDVLIGLTNSWQANPAGRTWTIGTASLFLPAAGICVDGDARRVGDDGDYWSSTPDDASFALCLYFDSDYCTVSYGKREAGLTVRLFCQLPSE